MILTDYSSNTSLSQVTASTAATKPDVAQDQEKLNSLVSEANTGLDQYGQHLTDLLGADTAAPVLNAIDKAEKSLTDLAQGAQAPFFFFKGLVFNALNAFSALAQAINELAADQPQIIAGEMGISNDLVTVIQQNFSQAWVTQLQADEDKLKEPNLTPQQIAQYQGQLNVDNSAAAASSAGLNGVLSLITQGVSGKTTTMQNLMQEFVQVATGGINTFSQDWVL